MNERSRFLHGPFAPVDAEITAFDLPMTGTLPAELNGRYLRNGPNPLDCDDVAYHWFTGPGMVHGVRIRDGRAEWYRNRWVRSRLLSEALGETWPAGPVFTDDAGQDHDFAANTHVLRHAGRVLATVEAGPLPYALGDELETLGPCDFGGTVKGGFAAHAKPDPHTGELHAVAYHYTWDHVRHVVVGPVGTVTRTTAIAAPGKPMMHDFALTETYVVLFDLPVTFDLDTARAGSRLPYTWNPTHTPRVGLLPRAGGELRWFEVDPCWVFHTLNAFDDGQRVVLDLCRYAGPFDASILRGDGPLTLERWTVDPAAGRVTRTVLDDRAQEFPRLDDRCAGRPHRYGYTAVIGTLNQATITDDVPLSNALLKHDTLTGDVEAHEFGRDATCGEAVFVPRAADAPEDDGYLLAYVQDPDRGATDLVVLAAQEITGEPVARIHLPARVPLGFHGNWLPDL